MREYTLSIFSHYLLWSHPYASTPIVDSNTYESGSSS